jgi:hypothetical protein
MVGEVPPPVTVNVTALLVAEPCGLEATRVYIAASAEFAPEIVRVVLLAPDIGLEPLYHCNVSGGEPDT